MHPSLACIALHPWLSNLLVKFTPQQVSFVQQRRRGCTLSDLFLFFWVHVLSHPDWRINSQTTGEERQREQTNEGLLTLRCHQVEVALNSSHHGSAGTIIECHHVLYKRLHHAVIFAHRVHHTRSLVARI